MKIQLAVLISGRGSNLAALIKACKKASYPAAISIVISDKPNAPGLKLAEAAGIPTRYVPHPSRCAFAIGIGWPLLQHRVDLIVLAGFMRVLQHGFVIRWQHKIINIHPSLLPAFPGLHPQRKALAAKHPTSGCTVHWVVPQVDAGPIIAQSAVPVLPDDNEDTLTARILKAEHKLYPLTIKKVANQLLKTREGKNKSKDNECIQKSSNFY